MGTARMTRVQAIRKRTLDGQRIMFSLKMVGPRKDRSRTAMARYTRLHTRMTSSQPSRTYFTGVS